MLTRLEPKFPEPTGNDEKDYKALAGALTAWFRRLNEPNVLSLDQAGIRAAQGVAFPATQIVSTDPNTLDDFEEGNTTPAVTAGTGAFTAASAALRYLKIGERVFFTCRVTVTTNGTAAAYIGVALPFAPLEVTALAGLDTTGVFALCGFNQTNGVMQIYKYDGTYPGVSGHVYDVFGSFRA